MRKSQGPEGGKETIQGEGERWEENGRQKIWKGNTEGRRKKPDL